MELEFIDNSLFSLINGLTSLVNMLVLGYTMNSYLYKKGKPSAAQGEIEKKNEFNVRKKLLKVELIASSYEHQNRSDVLISKVTEDRILENFEKAKESHFFLKKGISIKDLSEILCTNQRYVSYILNKYTGMDFNNFVQHARVDYVIESVQEDPDLLKAKFSVLADKGGFSSMSKFSTVFKAVKGISPSTYFQQLRAAV